MNQTSPGVEPAELLKHAAWLRRLAHALTGDGAAAEDAVQDTYLAALARPPTADRPVRPWLAAVVRNFLRRQHRARTRSERRERAVGAEEEAVTDPEELLARHQALRVVAELVAELDEPFRSTILLCYGEGLEPSEVARRLGVPAGTVRWRLKRALDLLRERLDARHDGDRRRWVLLLAPAGRRHRPRAGRWLVRGALTAGGVAALVLLTLALGAGSAGIERSRSVRIVSGGRLVKLPLVRLSVPATPASDFVIAGVVRDRGGRGIAGASVALVERRPLRDASMSDLGPVLATAVTDAAGSFRLGLPADRPCSLTVTAPGFEPSHEPNVSDGVPLAIVLSPGGTTLAGRVTERAGGPVPGARVVALDDRGFHDTDLSRAFVAVSGPDGRYRLGLAKGVHLVMARTDGYGQVSRVVSLYGAATEDFQLGPAGEVAGQVTDAGGKAVPGVVVTAEPLAGRAGASDGRSDAAGTFVVPHLAAGRYRLTARAGRLYLAAPPVVEVRESFRTEAVSVVLSGGTSIAGLATDPSGAPAAGVELFVLGPGGGRRSPEWVTGPDGRFRIDGLPPARHAVRVDERSPGELDGEAIADTSRGDAEVTLALRPGRTVRGQVLDASGQPAAGANVLGGIFEPGRARQLRTVADVEGRFIFRRLGPGRLKFGAEDERLGAVGQATDVAAGAPISELVLRLGPGVRVTGTVRWSDGTPAGGVLVRGFNGSAAMPVATRRARTGPDGSFTLEHAVSGDIRILATADDAAVDAWQRPPGPDCLFIPLRGGVAPPPLQLTLSR